MIFVSKEKRLWALRLFSAVFVWLGCHYAGIQNPAPALFALAVLAGLHSLTTAIGDD